MSSKREEQTVSIDHPIPSSSWKLDNNSLDKWLEDDLEQSTLFSQAKLIKCEENSAPTNEKSSSNPASSLPSPDEERYSTFEPSQCSEKRNSNTHTPIDTRKLDGQQLLPHSLLSLLKIYSILSTIRLHERQQQQTPNIGTTDKQPLSPKQSSTTNILYTIPLIQPPPSSLPSPVLSVENGTIKHITSNNKGKRSRQHADRSENNNLPSIDSVLLKRQRNTDAARRSRLRKLVKMETLEKRVEVLRANNEQLKVKLAVLESEVIHTAEKEERNRQRIQDLEAQLTVAHKQLVNEYQPKESKLEEVTTIEDTRKN